jgi:Alternative complex III, ActD subunit
MVAMSMVMSLVYLTELFYANFAGDPIEHASYLWRTTGPQSPLFWVLIFCNSIAPLSALFRRVRRSIPALFVLALLVNVGMWLERYVIVVSSLSHSYEPFTWNTYTPSVVELCIGGGFFGVFGLLFLLFVKLMPSVSIAETMQGLLPDGHGEIGEEQATAGGRGWVLGLFGRTTTAAAAVRGLRARGLRGARVQTPAPCAAAAQTGAWRWQRVLPWLALTGALLGLLGAIGLEAGTSLALPIVVGGKPILSWPAFGVIFFEFTMLGGGLFTFATTVLLCRASRRDLPVGIRDDIAYGRLVVSVPVAAGPPVDLAAVLRELGAEEVFDEA